MNPPAEVFLQQPRQCFLMSPPHGVYPFAGARTPRISPLHPQLSPSASSSTSSSSSSLVCKLYLASSAGSPRRHWYADSADNDIHCLHYSLVWEGTAVQLYAHADFERARRGLQPRLAPAVCVSLSHTHTHTYTRTGNANVRYNGQIA